MGDVSAELSQSRIDDQSNANNRSHVTQTNAINATSHRQLASNVNNTTVIDDANNGGILEGPNDQPIRLRNPTVGQSNVQGGLGAVQQNEPCLSFSKG